MDHFNLADYETVDSRIKRFYKDYSGGRIITELFTDFIGDVDSTRWIVKASVYKTDDLSRLPDATGLAFEVDGVGMANRKSALENCETSAIGRALANAGYSGDRRASREEMAKAKSSAKPVTVSLPDDCFVRIAAAKSKDDLQSIYEEAITGGWWTEEVRVAVATRNGELS